MRFKSKLVVLASACLLAVAGVATADDSVEEQLEQLNDRMEQLEGQLEDANQQIAAQDEVIREADLEAEERPGSNALSAYLEATEISAWVAASYNINFRNPAKNTATAGTTNTGVFQGYSPYNLFYPESNTVQFDQAWIGINKAPTEESRGGYNLDLVAGVVNNAQPTGPYDLGVYAASASYMFPIMNGFTVEGGLLATWQGAEVLQQNANLNITRGIQWNTQPVTNLGFIGALDMGGGFVAMIGMLNNSTLVDGPQDTNQNKAITSRLNYSADKFSIGAGVNWTKGDTTFGGTDHILLNVLASIDPTDNLTAYVDYTMNSLENSGVAPTDTKGQVHAISVATRLAVLDTTGIAVRGEIVKDKEGMIFGADDTLWSVTGTIDHALSDNVTVKVEIKYDGADTSVPASGFINGDGTGFQDVQVLGILQLMYEF
jgi:hypothetical protein